MPGGATRRLRRVLSLALLLLMAVAPPAEAAVLRVLTFNIHHGAGPDGRVDLDRLAAEIRAVGADVVALQEVDRHYGARSGSVDQVTELARRLGMHAAFAATVDLDPVGPDAPRRQFGSAILSHHPIRSHTALRLPGPGAEEPRGLLAAVLEVDGEPVRVATTHLSSESGASRLVQARAVSALVRGWGGRVLVVGDLNARPGDPEVGVLTAVLDDGCPGASTFPADAPAARIDYVLGRGRIVDCAVLPTASSDHRPLLAGVALG